MIDEYLRAEKMKNEHFMPVDGIYRKAILPLLLCALLVSSLSMAHASTGPELLLETGSAQKAGTLPSVPAVIKIVSYNMRWRGGEDLRELIELLRSDSLIGRAQIIGLQEVDRNKKRTRYTNTARMMAEELGLHYAWAAPPLAPGKEKEEEETGVAILSLYPLTDVTRIVLPNAGPGGRRRVALGATVHLGLNLVRVYTVHAETRTTNERRIEQFQAVLDDLAKHAKVERAAVMGDFNTITDDDVSATSELFTDAGFQTPFPNKEPTWKTFIIKLKLDWVWLRRLRALDYGINRKVGLSDHWPLWVNIRLDD
ncbi:MAG TPA: endonuclease/exonuclease/phosphatase family protein [Pyrinomonadaceae bacterium]|jgi:endonuclease/exonuclease/phosphatase family metal-dependent hydrolase|nr:endonuclease/exonuclease/phosphatase family protein [Pyrinomonadaceae bacterium]